MPGLVGCSSVGVHSQPRHASSEPTHDAELTSLRLQAEEQEQELRVLRSQLALARAEVQELRAEQSHEPARTAKISGDEALPWSGPDDPGQEVREELGIPGDERLPVTSGVPDLPEVPEPVEPRTVASAPTSPDADPRIEGYRRALRLIREEKFEQALMELDAFLTEHPSHPYADNALYWCGEVHYLRREYQEALRCFERIEKVHPWANKAPDALYRIGQIHLRRGDRARARAYFDKVREQFPNTAAARLALREDAS